MPLTMRQKANIRAAAAKYKMDKANRPANPADVEWQRRSAGGTARLDAQKAAPVQPIAPKAPAPQGLPSAPSILPTAVTNAFKPITITTTETRLITGKAPPKVEVKVDTPPSRAGTGFDGRTPSEVVATGKEEADIAAISETLAAAGPQPDKYPVWRTFQQGILESIPFLPDDIRAALPAETEQHPYATGAGRLAGEAAQIIPAMGGISALKPFAAAGAKTAALQGGKRIVAEAGLEGTKFGLYGAGKGVIEGAEEGLPLEEIPGKALQTGGEYFATGAAFGGAGAIIKNSVAFLQNVRNVSAARSYLGVSESATDADLVKATKALLKASHPDTGGSHEAFIAAQQAIPEAISTIKGGRVTPGFWQSVFGEGMTPPTVAPTVVAPPPRQPIGALEQAPVARPIEPLQAPTRPVPAPEVVMPQAPVTRAVEAPVLMNPPRPQDMPPVAKAPAKNPFDRMSDIQSRIGELEDEIRANPDLHNTDYQRSRALTNELADLNRAKQQLQPEFDAFMAEEGPKRQAAERAKRDADEAKRQDAENKRIQDERNRLSNRTQMDPETLAADYKARGMSRQLAWDQYVIDRMLRPEIDAKDFYKIFDAIGPSRIRLPELPSTPPPAKPAKPAAGEGEIAPAKSAGKGKGGEVVPWNMRLDDYRRKYDNKPIKEAQPGYGPTFDISESTRGFQDSLGKDKDVFMWVDGSKIFAEFPRTTPTSTAIETLDQYRTDVEGRDWFAHQESVEQAAKAGNFGEGIKDYPDLAQKYSSRIRGNAGTPSVDRRKLQPVKEGDKLAGESKTRLKPSPAPVAPAKSAEPTGEKVTSRQVGEKGKERPNIGKTPREVLDNFLAIDQYPGEVAEAKYIGVRTYGKSGGRLTVVESRKKSDGSFVSTSRDATKQEELDFLEGVSLGQVQIEGVKARGALGVRAFPDAGKTQRLYHQATGRTMESSKPVPTVPRKNAAVAKEAKKRVEGKASGGGTSALKATASVALPQTATQAKPVAPVRISDIVKDLQDAFVPIRSGHVRWGQRAGIFKVIPRVIRTRKVNDLPVIAHEVGHALQGLMFPGPLTPRGGLSSKNVPRAFWKELSPMAYPGADKKIVEGYAEFVRLFLTDPAEAQAKAPKFYQHFTGVLNGLPQVKAVVSKAQTDIARYIEQPAAAKVRSTLRSRFEKPRKGGAIDQTRKVAEDAYTHLLDDLYPVYKAEMDLSGGQKLPAEESAYLQHRLTRGSGAVADDWVFLGRTDRMGDPAGPSLKEVLRPVAKELEAFEEYAVSLHGLDVIEKLGDQAMPLPRAVYQEVVDTSPAHYQSVMRGLVKYQDALLDLYVKTGLLSAEGKAAMRQKWPNHVPLYRAMDDRPAGGAGTAGQPIKRLKGSGRDIYAPIESLVKDTFVAHHLSMNNEANLALVKLAAKTEGGGRYMEKFDAMPMQMKRTSLDQILTQAEKEMAEDAGLDVEALRKAFFTNYQTPRGEYVMRVFRNGEPEFYTVEPALYDTLAALDMSSRNVVIRALSVPTKLLRAGAILTPEFSVFRNPARDVLEVTLNSEQWMTPVDFVLGYYHATTKSPIYRQARALGGGQSALVSPDIDTMKMALRAIKESGTLDVLGNTIKHPVDALRAVSAFFEEGNRTAEYVSRVRAGKAETRSERMEANFAKRESSVDFGRRGRTGKLLNQIKAFFNAAMQGGNRFVRVHKTSPGRSLLRGTLYITLPTILLYLKNKDDEEYQRLPEWRKDMFWNFPFTWGGKRYFFPVPIPHLWGLAYKVIPERIMRQIGEKDPHAWDEFARTVGNTALPFDDFLSAMPTALEPLLRTIANRSFTNAPIVPRREQDLPKPLQIGPYTSGLARAIGNQFNLSPRQIDSIVYGYTGGLGRHGVNLVSAGLQAAKVTDIPPKPAAGVSEWPVLRAAVMDPRQVESVYISRFYDELTELEQQAKMADAKEKEFAGKERLGVLRSTSRKLSAARKSMRAVFDARTTEDLRLALDDDVYKGLGIGDLPVLKRRALDLLSLVQEELAKNPTGGSSSGPPKPPQPPKPPGRAY